MSPPECESRPGGESGAARDRWAATSISVAAATDVDRCSECGAPISSAASLATGLGGRCRQRLRTVA